MGCVCPGVDGTFLRVVVRYETFPVVAIGGDVGVVFVPYGRFVRYSLECGGIGAAWYFGGDGSFVREGCKDFIFVAFGRLVYTSARGGVVALLFYFF